MTFKISTLKIRQQLGDILNRVALRQDEFIIERKGKPLAAVIPIEKMERIKELARHQALDLLKRQAEATKDNPMTEDEAMEIANEAKREARKTLKARKIKKLKK